MAKRTFWFSLITVMSLTFTAASSLACVCFMPDQKTMRDVAAWYSEGPNASKIIFAGLVEKQDLKTGPIGPPGNTMSMTTSGVHRVVHIHVLHVYRGQAAGDEMVLTGMGTGDCGFDFETGKQYLVYADRIDAENLFTSICAGTSSLDEAGPALRYLRGEKPTPDDGLDIPSYYKKFSPQWTGSACGRVTDANGDPFAKASVDMTQVRDDPFPAMDAGDPNLSDPDGTFCIQDIRAGKYLLTAWRMDYDNNARWMGYYPSVERPAEAISIEIHPGDRLSGLDFSVRKERVYTALFRIITPGGSALPLERLGVSIDSTYRDALAYHLTQNRNENGLYPAGDIPAGRYLVQTYIQPDFETGKIPAELSKWRMAKQEVDIPSDSQILLKLTPAK